VTGAKWCRKIVIMPASLQKRSFSGKPTDQSCEPSAATASLIGRDSEPENPRASVLAFLFFPARSILEQNYGNPGI